MNELASEPHSAHGTTGGENSTHNTDADDTARDDSDATDGDTESRSACWCSDNSLPCFDHFDMTNDDNNRDASRIESKSTSTPETGPCRNEDWPDGVSHGNPANLGDDVVIGDTKAYIARIEDDTVYLGEQDGDREFVVPRSLVPSHAVRNPVNK